jgi:hypothetical protein
MAKILWLADALRDAGLTVVEHSGWKDHAVSGSWTPTYGIAHATAAPKSQPDDTQVRIVRDGRSDLRGPIANACVDRRGRWHVLSAGRCNTTIVGTAGPYKGLGNTNALGVEACNDNRSEPWPAVQYESYYRGWAVICKRLGWQPSRVRGHKEHTPGHKTDPTFNMDQFRRDIAAAMDGDDDMTPEQAKQLQRIEAHVTALANRVYAMMQMRHEAKYTIPGEAKPRVEPNKMGYAVYDTNHILTALAHGADEATVHQPDGSAGQLSLAPLYARLAGGDVDEQALATHLGPLLQPGVTAQQVKDAVQQALREAAARIVQD